MSSAGHVHLRRTVTKLNKLLVFVVEYLTHSTDKYPHLLFVSKLLKNIIQIISRKKPHAESKSIQRGICGNGNSGWPALYGADAFESRLVIRLDLFNQGSALYALRALLQAPWKRNCQFPDILESRIIVGFQEFSRSAAWFITSRQGGAFYTA